MTKTITNIVTAIDNVFKELEELHNFKTGTPKTMAYNCCMSCSWSNFEDGDNVVFYHSQDLESARESNYLMIAWSISPELLDIAISTFLKHRVHVQYDGTSKTRFLVTMAGTYENEGKLTIKPREVK